MIVIDMPADFTLKTTLPPLSGKGAVMSIRVIPGYQSGQRLASLRSSIVSSGEALIWTSRCTSAIGDSLSVGWGRTGWDDAQILTHGFRVLPTDLVARYRAVDREVIPAPDWVVDTPSHLDALAASVAEEGIKVPLELRFNASFGFLDGNHRLAVARRLGLEVVPVTVIEVDDAFRADHGRPMRAEDLRILRATSGSSR